MAKDDTVSIVRRRIREDKQHSENIASELSKRGKPIADSDFRQFFPELTALESWCNNPYGDVKLPHYLLAGYPSVFLLEPLESEELFEQKHRIDIPTAERFVDEGLLLPNLYVRSAEKWKGKKHLHGLLENKKTMVVGERVDRYLRARDEAFACKADAHKEFLEGIWTKLGTNRKNALAKLAVLEEDPDAVPMAIGKRWAYLDILDPTSSTYLEKLFLEAEYETAVKYLRGAQCLYSAPLISSLDGYHVWDPVELAAFETISETRDDFPLRQRRDLNIPERTEESTLR